jgi:hypothetical protein
MPIQEENFVSGTSSDFEEMPRTAQKLKRPRAEPAIAQTMSGAFQL